MFDLKAIDERRLGSEQEVTDFLDKLYIKDLYNDKIITWDKLEQGTSVASGWVAKTFRNDFLPEPQPVVTNESTLLNPEMLDPWVKPEVRSQLLKCPVTGPVTVRNQLLHHKNQYTNLSAMTREVAWQLESLTGSLHNRQQQHFGNQLKEKNFIKKRNERELLKEINLRKQQFPGHPIYIITGNNMSGYLDNMYEDAFEPNTLRLNWGYRYWGDQGLSDWDSAVIAKPQVRAKHELHIQYNLERLNRRWGVEIWSCAYFTLEMDECVHEEQELVKPPTKGMEQFNFMSEL